MSSRPFALVTGSSKGIGFAVAAAFVKKGFDVCVHGRDERELLRVRSTLHEIDAHAHIPICAADLSQRKGVNILADTVLQSSHRLDVLVNNAGVFLGGSIIDEEEGQLEKLIDTNLYSAYHLTRRLISRFLQQGAGHIFNICSIASLAPYAGASSYCISKFAMLGFSKCLREELKGKGIKVTSVMPGATWSNSWQGVDYPYDRLMEAQDIAKAVVAAVELSPAAVVEEIVMRPQKGDL